MYRVFIIIIVLISFGCTENCKECKLIFEDNISEARKQCNGLQSTFPEFSTSSVVDLGTDCDDVIDNGKIESETVTVTDCTSGSIVATSRSRITCVKVE